MISPRRLRRSLALLLWGVLGHGVLVSGAMPCDASAVGHGPKASQSASATGSVHDDHAMHHGVPSTVSTAPAPVEPQAPSVPSPHTPEAPCPMAMACAVVSIVPSVAALPDEGARPAVTEVAVRDETAPTSALQPPEPPPPRS